VDARTTICDQTANSLTTGFKHRDDFYWLIKTKLNNNILSSVSGLKFKCLQINRKNIIQCPVLSGYNEVLTDLLFKGYWRGDLSLAFGEVEMTGILSRRGSGTGRQYVLFIKKNL